MLDFNHVVNAPGFNVQAFYGTAQTTLLQWQTWIKPRGSRMLWLIAVGGGGSGGNGTNTATTSGGGGGGGSGAQSSVILPSTMVPDILYIQAGRGGKGAASSGAAGAAGLPSYISLEPNTSLVAANTLLFANGGNGGGGATTTAGGAGGTGGTAATITNMPLAGRGIYQFFAGQTGTAGGAQGVAGTNLSLPDNGLMVSGGAGGGGKTAATFTKGGDITGAGFGEFLPTILGGAAAVGSTPAQSGNSLIARNFIMNYGGSGGGSASETSGGIAGIGGEASPGAGGGGAGGASSTAGVTTLAVPGDGGDGFVLVLSW